MEDLKSHYSKKIEEMRRFYEDTIDKLENQLKIYERRTQEEDDYRVSLYHLLPFLIWFNVK